MKRKRPEQPLSQICRQRPEHSDVSSKGIDKRVTTLGVVDKEADENGTGGLLSPTLFIPSDEQLAKINSYTLRRVSADEVACFTTNSMNDLTDRDDERFRTSCVKGFASLEYPYSPTGKSYMVGHDYTKLAVGRIFDTGTKSLTATDGTKVVSLTNDVYIPRIAANEAFIQNMEYGINWAVSVGVMVGKSACPIGKEHDWGWWPWFCTEGHEKGLYYDPESDEEDDWGYPLPVSESAKNAVKCVRDLDEAKDMYELSQVFLGAQYMAEIQRSAGLDAIVKTPRSFPVIGLSRSEADRFPTPKVPAKLTAAARRHKVTEADSSFRWTDEQGLVWSFTPGEDSDPLCLGRSSKDLSRLSEIKVKATQLKMRYAEVTEAQKSLEGAAAIAAQLDGLITTLDDALDSDNDDAADTLIDQVQDLMEDLFDELSGEGDDEQNEEEDYGQSKGAIGNPVTKQHTHYHDHSDGTGHSHYHGHAVGGYDHGPDDDVTHAHTHDEDGKTAKEDYMSKKAVLAAATKVSFPRSIMEKVEEAPEEGKQAFLVLISETSKVISDLTPKAVAGEAYLKDLRAEVIDMYVKSNTPPGGANGGVDVSGIEKLLNRVGDDPEVMKTLRDEYLKAFQTKFPAAVRRSSFETNHNEGEKPPDLPSADIEHRIDAKSVQRLHG